MYDCALLSFVIPVSRLRRLFVLCRRLNDDLLNLVCLKIRVVAWKQDLSFALAHGPFQFPIHSAFLPYGSTGTGSTAPYCFLANVNLCSGSLYAIAVPSVCRLSVCDVGAP